FFAYKGLQRTVHGASQYFGGSAADDSLNDAVDSGAIVDVAPHEGRIDRLGGHENHLEIDALLAIETFVISDVERQKADVGRLDTHPDPFHGCLRIKFPTCNKNKYDREETIPLFLFSPLIFPPSKNAPRLFVKTMDRKMFLRRVFLSLGDRSARKSL